LISDKCKEHGTYKTKYPAFLVYQKTKKHKGAPKYITVKQHCTPSPPTFKKLFSLDIKVAASDK
jgi:hypothetical protein